MIRFIRIAAITSSSHLVRLLTALIILKLLATQLGPAGLGFWGNFISLVSIATSLAGGGILSGTIKYVAEFYTHTARRDSFISSALVYSLGFSLLVLLLGEIFSESLSRIIFGSTHFVSWIHYFLLLQCVVAVNNVVYGIINGEKKTGTYALCVIIGNLMALLFAVKVIPTAGANGAFWAIFAPILFPFFPVLWVLLHSGVLTRLRFETLVKDTRLLAGFSIMLAFSTMCFPVVEILVRNQIIAHISLDAAGYWQAVTRISAAFLSFCSLFLTVYFIPVTSAETNKKILFSRTLHCMGLMALAIMVLMLLVSFCGQYLIRGLYSEAFLIIKPWLQLQLTGDLFRVMAWVIGFLIVAKARTGWYILCELFQGGVFLLLAVWQIYSQASVLSVIEAYVLTCILYFMVLFAGFIYYFRSNVYAFVLLRGAKP